jgi:hypothetical protein
MYFLVTPRFMSGYENKHKFPGFSPNCIRMRLKPIFGVLLLNFDAGGLKVEAGKLIYPGVYD